MITTFNAPELTDSLLIEKSIVGRQQMPNDLSTDIDIGYFSSFGNISSRFLLAGPLAFLHSDAQIKKDIN